MAQGDDVVWIGPPEGLPEALWIGAFRIADGAALAATLADAAPLDLALEGLAPASASSAFILAPKSMPQHNVDEEPRADFLPIFEARDRFGAVVGYPGALVSYYAPSLAKGRFAGSHAYLFLYDAPLEALPAASWAAALERIAQRLGSGLQVTACDTDYAAYGPGERVRIRVRVRNDRPEAVELGLDPFGLVHLTDAGAALVEGAGRIAVDGALVCEVAQGRAVIAAEPDGAVERAEALRICVTGPTTLTFGAPITALAASDGSDAPSRAAPGFAAGSRQLEIDAELSRYVLHVTLDRQGG